MGKRKKSSRKPAPKRKADPLDTTFTCLFCHHDQSVTVKLDRKEGVAQLVCKVCGQSFQSKVNHLTEPIDIYSEWLDAADYAAKEEERRALRRPVASSSRARPTGPPSIGSEED
ncbi:Elf1-domain-containing protein [Lactarius akahatsu]|uniref:Transcription elongation factor 1 homolog n=1 Tax=Lactarius akahatsu TaxID=416441 RepID=A0AAD4LQE9_9AGAM|nr:Elf1-domain-containing protein [Lactarius akahatsu]